MISILRCPKCGSDKLNKAGIAKCYSKRYQKYYCRECYITTQCPIKELARDDIVETQSLATEENNNEIL